ncbi:NAD(+) diphosphatase [Niveibacterium sp. 24ML]|uniref:NAD(+) diphosphatase n=1 Tax=Niveibacterium sp. 24ML TaxID=2985512 RepID=UPI002271EF8E|nr:NAD(+) diphosphatase [Niveibacterium sp. 24ML]MCX9157490.1 NAD(+) diphosphatase [Niveibacterium sp. 24ML]
MLLPETFQVVSFPYAGPAEAGLWFIFHHQGLVITGAEGAAELVTAPALHSLGVDASQVRGVGRLGKACCWVAHTQCEELPPGFSAEPLRSLFNRLPEALLAIAGRAQQLLDFERSHRFCGACGAANEAFDECRAKRCPACGQIAYPRLAPAMMVLVKRDGPAGRELLLAHGARFPGVIYSALAGFVEPSESVEDCAHREVFEEVGLRIKNLRYFGSQCWPFPNSLMIAFVADWAGGEIVADPAEILDAAWFPIDALPPLPHQITIARRLINATIAEVAPEHPALTVYGAG